ncbi:hypothetical protein KKF38_02425 [Patescibacteria group bacterium]|nr:hypothetical protein [Patescibacteria group bacterium]
MKIRYLVGAMAITLVLLIIAFQNIQTNASFVMFFSFKSMPMTFPVLVLTVFGMAAGSLYTLAIQSILNKKEKEIREEEGSEF